MTQEAAQHAWQVLENADRLYSDQDVEAAYSRIAAEVNRDLRDTNPVVVCILNGAIVPFGILLPRLQFPLQTDYLHATRYRGELAGGSMNWIAKPYIDPKDRTILLIDDILDEGLTLAAIEDYYLQHGAKEVYKLVLIVKDRERQADIVVDYIGLTVPNRYVFGCGMDYKTYLRNANGIYALKES